MLYEDNELLERPRHLLNLVGKKLAVPYEDTTSDLAVHIKGQELQNETMIFEIQMTNRTTMQYR